MLGPLSVNTHVHTLPGSEAHLGAREKSSRALGNGASRLGRRAVGGGLRTQAGPRRGDGKGACGLPELGLLSLSAASPQGLRTSGCSRWGFRPTSWRLRRACEGRAWERRPSRVQKLSAVPHARDVCTGHTAYTAPSEPVPCSLVTGGKCPRPFPLHTSVPPQRQA